MGTTPTWNPPARRRKPALLHFAAAGGITALVALGVGACGAATAAVGPPSPRPPATAATTALATSGTTSTTSPPSTGTTSTTPPATPATTTTTVDTKAAEAKAAADVRAAADAKAAAAAAAPVPLAATGSGAQVFKNCAELNVVYPHGVGRSGAVDHVSGGGKGVTTFTVDEDVYNANPGRDGDNDGIACEKR